MFNDIIDIAVLMVRAELIVAGVMLGLLIVIGVIFGIFWLLVKLGELTEEKQEDPMDMFMGGRGK